MPDQKEHAAGLVGVPGLLARWSGPTSRRTFVKWSGATAAALAVGACGDDNNNNNPTPVLTLPLQNDTDIFNFALFLELLERDFYTQATASGKLSGNILDLAGAIQQHESDHVDAIKGKLGSAAIDESKVEFNFGTSLDTQASFLATAQTLEETGVAAYLGAIGMITSKANRRTAGSIFTIEARHAAAIRTYNNAAPVPNAFESGKSPADIVAAVKATGFVTKGL